MVLENFCVMDRLDSVVRMRPLEMPYLLAMSLEEAKISCAEEEAAAAEEVAEEAEAAVI